jgi:DNA-binding response OmpR family regulator
MIAVNIPTLPPADGPVLVIDDSLTIRKLLEMTLQRAGFTPELATLGSEGLALARRLRPRLILLDYVLPDAKGTAICDELERDPLTADVPVVIMSGKGDDIRPLFRGRRAVVEVIAKPFAPAEIMHVVTRALARTAATAPRPAVVLPVPAMVPAAAVEAPVQEPPTGAHARDPREVAARVLFAALRDRLARVPEWLADVGTQPPAQFLARRLLTPDAVGAVMTGLTPLLKTVEPAPAPAPVPAAPAPGFAGSTSFLALLPLLRVVAETHRTGVLHVGSGEDGLDAWFDRGDLRLAVPCAPAAARRVLSSAGLVEEPGRAAGWAQSAQAAGVAQAVVAAADGGLPAIDALHRLGRQALVQLAGEGPQPWQWSDYDALPSLIERVARTISLDQLNLDRLRQVDDWSQIELEVRSLDQVCRRAVDFRTRLAGFELTPDETRVLLRVDGRIPVKDLLAQVGLSTFEVFHILYRLIQVRLIHPQDGAVVAAGSGPVLWCGAVDTAVTKPLAAWLGRRSEAVELVFTTPEELVSRILAAAPRLVLFGAGAGIDAAQLAGTVRAHLEISDTRMAVLVPAIDRVQHRALRAAGIDQVLVRPVHLNAIDRLLSPRPTPN